jgi:hypothetical protein
LSSINRLLAQSLNYLPWVIVGLLSWGAAFWQLYIIKSDTFGKIVTLILSVLPMGIAFVSFNVAVARWGSEMLPAVLFLVVGLFSFGYFLWLYFHEKTKVRAVLAERNVFSKSPARMVGLIIQLLIGAISVLASVALLISGGWELIQGSITIGVIIAPLGAAIFFLDTHFKYPWNFLERCYSALAE